ncbi:MAG: ArsA-related P-loop ATPase [Myxococcota bacterium]
MTVDGPENIWDRQLVLVTGKGGVGKTTVAAAMASAAQRAGRRVLLGEVTPDGKERSNLLELFGQPRPQGEAPIELMRGLDGVLITPSAGHRLILRAALKVGMVADAAMRSAALNRFLMAAPAFPEIGTLYQIVHLLRANKWDHIILDLPATGHALGLASLPRTVLRIVPVGMIGEAIREGLEAMTNPDRGGAVVVTLPEDMPVTESLELAAGLGKLSVPIRAMVLNQMPHFPFSADEIDAVDRHLAARADVDPLLLGSREFRRLQRALMARERFRAETPAGVTRAEFDMLIDHAPVDVVHHLAERFAGAAGGAA